MSRSGSEKRKRTVMLTCRVDDDEASAIRQIADRADLSLADLMRRTLLNATPVRPRHKPKIDRVALVRLQGELGKIGGNINQLAKYANLGRTQLASIDLALRDLAELRLPILQALGCEPRRPDDQP